MRRTLILLGIGLVALASGMWCLNRFLSTTEKVDSIQYSGSGVHSIVAPERPVEGTDAAQRSVESRPGSEADGRKTDRPQRNGSISGSVVGDSETPVSGAVVHLLHSTTAELGMTEIGSERRIENRRGESDEHGQFTFADLPATKVYAVFAESNSGCSSIATNVSVGHDVVLRIQPRASLTGRVLDSLQAPISGACVVVKGMGPSSLFGRSTATSDSNGGYLFESLPAGSVTLSASNQMGIATFPVGVKLVAGEEARCDITIETSGRILGRVVDDANNAPIDQASVFVTFLEGTPIASTNEEGEFQVQPGATWKDVPLQIVARGYGSLTVRVPAPGSSDGRVDVRLKKGRTVRGRLVSESGHALAGYTVAAAGEYVGSATHHWKNSTECRAAETGLDGSFELRDLSQETRHVLLVRGPECANASIAIGDRESGAGDVDLGNVVVERGTAILGTVSVDGATTVPVTQVRLYPAALADVIRSGDSPALGVGLHDLRSLQAGADGRFKFSSVGRGAWIIEASSSARVDTCIVPIFIDGTADEVSVQCTFGEGLSITGQLRFDDAPPPAARFIVELSLERSPTQQFAAQLAEASGRFCIRGLPDGVFTIRVRQDPRTVSECEEYERTKLDHAYPSSRELDIPIRRSAKTRVQVVDRSGRAVAAVRVSAVDAAGELVASAFSNLEGSALLGLPRQKPVRILVDMIQQNEQGAPSNRTAAIEENVIGEDGKVVRLELR